MKKALIPLILASTSLFGVSLFSWSSESAWANVVAPAEMRLPPERPAISVQGFDIEVLVDGIPLPEYYARGRQYVEALENAEYELRVRNPTGVRVAVALSVDGLNTIDARHTTAANASKWVIEPYGTITIGGWQMSSARARRFYFTTERDSYGAKLGQTANLGVISAVFFRERRPVAVVQPPPRRPRSVDESAGEGNRNAPEPSASGQARDSSDSRLGSAKQKSAEASPAPDGDYAATGIGRNMRHDVRWVNLDLENRPAAEVTMRYEYRAALVRLGINPRPYPYHNADTLRRRESASGFEDRRYSPEP